MDCLAGRPETFQQICQRTFKVLFVTRQARFPPCDPGKREQNQQRLMWRALSVRPPKFYLAKLVKKFVAFHNRNRDLRVLSGADLNRIPPIERCGVEGAGHKKAINPRATPMDSKPVNALSTGAPPLRPPLRPAIRQALHPTAQAGRRESLGCGRRRRGRAKWWRRGWR